MSRYETIGETIRQGRPIESLETEVLLTLIRTTDLVACAANAPLQDADLSVAQYNALRILRGSPDGLQTHQVLERMLTRAPNLTRLVDKLQDKGLLRRTRSDLDRRVVTLTITDAGLELLRNLEAPMARAVRTAMTGLEAGELSHLCDALNRLRAPHEHRVCDPAGTADE